MTKDILTNLFALGVLFITAPVIGMLLYHLQQNIISIWRTSNFLEKIIILTMSIGVILFCVGLGGLLWKL